MYRHLTLQEDNKTYLNLGDRNPTRRCVSSDLTIPRHINQKYHILVMKYHRKGHTDFLKYPVGISEILDELVWEILFVQQ